MQRIFVARNVTEAHIVSGMLNAAGILAEVRGHYLAGGYGELPISSDTLPSVWLSDAAQADNARTLIAEGLPPHAVQLVESTDREIVGHLLSMGNLIDVTIPRGGKSLIERVVADQG